MWQVLSTREWAVGFWGLFVFGVLLSRRGGRSGLRRVTTSFFGEKRLVIAWLSMAAWFAVVILVAARLGAWNTGLWKDTIWWLLLASWGTFMATPDALKQQYFFRNAVKKAFAVSVISQFVLNVATLPLIVEFLLQPTIAILFMFRVVAERNGEQQVVVKMADVLLIIIGLLFITWTIYQLSTQPQEYFTAGKGYELAFSVWLPLAMLGWIYPIALLMAYDDLRTIYKARVLKRPDAVQFIKILIAYNVALHDVVNLRDDARLSTEVAETTSVSAIRALRRQKAARVGRQASAKNIQAQRLERFADVEGRDPQGFIGSAPAFVDSRGWGGSGRVSGLVECLVLDGREASEGLLAAPAVVGRLDPGDDRQA